MNITPSPVDTRDHETNKVYQNLPTYTGWWFGTLGLFFHILRRIIPTDLHIFQRG
jgi:hypothetical protein